MQKKMSMMTDQLLLSSEQAAESLGLSRSSFYALHSSGRLGPMPIKLNRRTLWSREELEAWVRGKCVPRSQWVNRDSEQ